MLCSFSERGQGIIEYAFIIILVAIVAMIGISLMGGLVQNMYITINNHI